MLAQPSPPRVARWGRPRREFAGEVERRILDAATAVFLERGLEGATIDEIAERARAGKPTIYARFANKQAIFHAVAARRLAESRTLAFEAKGVTAEDRLRSLATALVERSIEAGDVDFMRTLVGEARRFPELATDVLRMVRDRNAETLPPLLCELAGSDTSLDLSAFAPDRVYETTRRFVELVILPMTIRALFGENFAGRRDEIEAHVAKAVGFFLAALRSRP